MRVLIVIFMKIPPNRYGGIFTSQAPANKQAKKKARPAGLAFLSTRCLIT